MVSPSTYPYLSRINSPEDLRGLRPDELPAVCGELRHFLIEELAHNPGHFASSLCAIELTVAVHYVYATPYDRLVWDVGHQAYAHKLLTGRREQFASNRKTGGMRPFPSPLESEYDTFACGHASNSISAALGMSLAALHKHEEGRHVVAVIGDGSMSGGLAFEGINNAADTPNNLLIILNDNNMSIDRSVGGLGEYLNRLHTSSFYNRARLRLSERLASWGWLNDTRRRSILRFNNSLKSLLANQQNIFEGMDIRYFGPVDGHNVVELVRVLREIKEMRGPKLLHLHTTKGKGYRPAELSATEWHAPGCFDPESGCREVAPDSAKRPPRFQDVFGETLLELAQQNDRIVGVTPAMPTGCSMNILMNALPHRAFDVGIAEGHAVTFSAGMAKEGLIPFCNIYSSFAQRAYDNIIHDAALLRLPVVLCLDRAGLVGEDGPTHHGAFDLAALRPVPGLTIASPMDECELRRLMYTAQQPDRGTFVIRYPRGSGRRTDWRCPLEAVAVGTGRRLTDGTDVAVITLGPIGQVAADAIARLAAKGIRAAHYDLRFLKPLDEALLTEVGKRFSRVVCIEDGVRQGGMGSAVLEYLSDHGYATRVLRLGLPDAFVEHGAPADLYRLVGLDCASLEQQIADFTRGCHVQPKPYNA